MLTRRIARAATAAPRSLRALSSTAAQQRAPSIADVTPAGVDSFNAKQKEFREQTIRAQQEREASRSSSAKSKSSTSSGASPNDSGSGEGLGSLTSSAGRKAEAEAAKGKEGADHPDGLLSRVIYGTKEGREMDAQLEASFSAVLARGKYVHSIVFHQVYPDKVEEYMELVGNWYPKMASMEENKVHLVGSWRTEVGDCDTFVHIWEYQRYQGYHQSLHSISRHPDFPEFDRKLKTLIKSKNTSIMQEFSFWPTTAPRQLGGVFELRSYTLHPGNLLEWETHWRRGLKARREVMEGVGAWFVQIGDLNTVHHLWQFADLEERKVRREESWKQEGWAETVHKTVPLIQSMKSRVLVPMPWSPVA
ncbi:Uu.00g115950.m01.CDS01 [Anthostomella pinea]|uniref:Uu.00g115950.m01.CDS01 n=1 Tax=Anthostomella pinea TaxID=933095 RepID=A0AAI8YGT4_9PEZI|nr:Uu.00g115950.m01.CDS01 [Anthostomella pinea]